MCNAPSAISHSRWKSSPNWKTPKASLWKFRRKKKGNWYWKLSAGRCGRTAGRRWKRDALHRVCRLYEAQDEYRKQTAGIYYRRPLRILSKSIRSGTREDVPLTHDLFPSDGTPHFCGTTLQGNEHTKWGAVSSWIIKMLGQPAYNRAQHYAVFYARFDVHL